MTEKDRAIVASGREALFRPITINGLTLPNRIVMSAMGQGHGQDGVPDEAYPAYYQRRAEGEIGLIISGATAIPHPSAAMDVAEPHFHGDAALAGWKRAIDAVHAAGGRMIPQLWHTGLHGLAYAPTPWPQQGPSGIWFGPPRDDGTSGPSEVRGEPMTQAEIDGVIEAHAVAVATARELGFDGVEIHGAHGFLVDQFLWHATNRRTDRYGGPTLRERVRFAVEIVQECRRRAGPDFPIVMRISQFKMMDYTARLAETPEELAQMLEPLVDAGVDAFDCSIRRFWQPAFEGSDLNLAGWVKRLSGKPTIACGGVGLGQGAASFGDTGVYGKTAAVSLNEFDRLCAMLDRGEFDLVAIGRAVLGDAHWARKVREGREHELTPFTPDLMMSLC